MIKITKTEAEIMRKRARGAHIAIVNRHKPYKRYYIEESDRVIEILLEIRPDYRPPMSYRPKVKRANGKRW